MSLDPLDEKWRAFGWEVVEVDGNDIEQLVDVLTNIPKATGKPTMIIAHTVKGKGISFAENVTKWHHHVPSEEEYKLAMEELSKQLEVVR
jgi:transketolase